MPPAAELDKVALLVTFARKKGFNVEVSVVPGLWRLVGIRDLLLPARAPAGGLAFSPDGALGSRSLMIFKHAPRESNGFVSIEPCGIVGIANRVRGIRNPAACTCVDPLWSSSMKRSMKWKTALMAASSLLLGSLAVGGAAHAITDNVFRYSTPQTGFINVPPTAHVPQYYADQYAYQNNGVLKVLTNTLTCFRAVLYLPDKATIREFSVWYSNSGGALSLTLLRNENSEPGEQIASKVLADTGSVNTVARAKKTISGAGSRVDNEHYGYWIQYCAQNSLNSGLFNVRITYSYTNAGD
jgi:hypothetical protein